MAELELKDFVLGPGGHSNTVRCGDPECPCKDWPEPFGVNPKHNAGIKKASLSCVPAPVLMEVGIGMQEGAAKYGRHNYRAVGILASVYYDATMRHVMAWWEGEDIDSDSCTFDEQTGEPIQESGLSHITKAICSLVVLRDAMIQNKVTDDRPPKSNPWLGDLNKKSESLFDKYPNPVSPYTELK